MTVAFLPFATALLSEYLGHDGERTATIVYTGWFLVVALRFNLLWRNLSTNQRLLASDADPVAVAAISKRFYLGPPSYLVAFIAAFIYPPASLVMIGLLALLYLLPTAIGRH